jgi:hypothetical protein
MTQSDLESFFAALEAALAESPFRAIPIDVDGKRHEIQRRTSIHLPSDVVELLTSPGAIERLKRTVDSHGHKVQRNADGSINLIDSIPSRGATT